MALHFYLKHPRAANPDGSWNVPELLKAYYWPTGLKGGGKIGIIELGGAYVPTDMAQFCATNNVPAPAVNHVYVGGGAQTNPQDDATGEVMLDGEIAAAAYSAATGLPAEITYFWCTDILPGVRAAHGAGMDVFSCSWGQDEATYGAGPLHEVEAAVNAAAVDGMAMFAAAGDNDSSDGGSTPANVDGPGSCPHVICCGGTSKTNTTEVVWNNNPGQTNGEGTGGGYSTVFPAETWQVGAPPAPPKLGRMVPDVSANADPETGYNIVLNGSVQTIGGTSAVAPLYAGLVAACGPKPGWIGEKIWADQTCFTDITKGDNGVYSAGPGPDPCSGIGALIAEKLAALLTGTAVTPPVHNRRHHRRRLRRIRKEVTTSSV